MFDPQPLSRSFYTPASNEAPDSPVPVPQNHILLKDAPMGRRKLLAYFRDSDDLKELTRYWKAFSTQSNYFDHAQLTTILNGLVRILGSNLSTSEAYSFRKGRELESWFEKFSRLQSVDPALLVKNWDDFSELRVRPDLNFRQVTSGLRDFGSLSENKTARLLYRQADLGVLPSRDFIASVLRHVGPSLQDHSVKSLASYAWSMAVFSILSHSDEFKRPAALFTELCRDKPHDSADTLRLNIATKLFDLPDITTKTFIGGERKSYWELNLQDHFEKAGNSIMMEELHFCPPLGRCLDLRFRTILNKEVIVEADGPFHMVFDIDNLRSSLDGMSLVQSAVMEKIYPDAIILRLDYRDSQLLERRENGKLQTDILTAHLTREFHAADAGVYRSFVENGNIGLRHLFGSSALPAAPAAPAAPIIAPPETAPVTFTEKAASFHARLFSGLIQKARTWWKPSPF